MGKTIEINENVANMKISEVLDELLAMEEEQGQQDLDSEAYARAGLHYMRLLGKLEGLCELLDLDTYAILVQSGLAEPSQIIN